MPQSPLTDHFRSRNLELLEISPRIYTPTFFSDPHSEHSATRNAVGICDFSFMASFAISGSSATKFLSYLQIRNIEDLPIGKIAYTLLCRPNGSVLIDATVWRLEKEKYWLFIGRREDRTHIFSAANRFQVEIYELSDEIAIIAIQGGKSDSVLSAAFGIYPAALPYYQFIYIDSAEFRGTLARIGYSGEFGYELIVPANEAETIWRRLVSSGMPYGLKESGFLAMNSLRIEAGYILFSHELKNKIDPFDLSLEKLLTNRGKDWIGAEMLQQRKYRPCKRRLVGLLPKQILCEQDFQNMCSEKIPQEIMAGIGILTSIAYSPTQDRMLGMGYVGWEDHHAGTTVRLGSGLRALVTRLPYYDPLKILARRTTS